MAEKDDQALPSSPGYSISCTVLPDGKKVEVQLSSWEQLTPGFLTQIIDAARVLPGCPAAVAAHQQEGLVHTQLSSLCSPRTAQEIHSILLLACSPGPQMSLMFAQGVATALLWQLGRIGPPEAVFHAPSSPSRGRVAEFFQLAGDPASMTHYIWEWHVRGIIAGLGWLMGFGETDDLRYLIEVPELARQRFAAIPVLVDPWLAIEQPT